MRTTARLGAWTAGLLVALALATVGSAAVGPVALEPLVVAKATLNAVGLPTGVDLGVATARLGPLAIPVPIPLPTYTYPFDFAVPATAETIVRDLRLPRIALAAVVALLALEWALAVGGPVGGMAAGETLDVHRWAFAAVAALFLAATGWHARDALAR